MATSQSCQSPFSAAVRRILEGWSVLQLAVDNGFGGVDSAAKAAWIVEAISQWFMENSNLEAFEVADFLADILNHEFNTIADDGSLGVVSTCVCDCYRLVRQGKEAELAETLDGLPQAATSHRQAHGGQSDSSGGDTEEESMDTQDTQQAGPQGSAPHQPPPAVNGNIDPHRQNSDDEGWTCVTKSKKR